MDPAERFPLALNARRALAQRLSQLLLGLFVAACGSEVELRPPTAWVPEDASVPVAVSARAPLPLCGVTGAVPPPAVAGCALDAFQRGAPAEMVMDYMSSATRRFVLILRVLPGEGVDIITGIFPQGRPWLWEITRCEGIHASTVESTSIAPEACGPLMPIGG